MSEKKDFLQPAIPRFDGHYDHWSMLMENLLRSKSLWSLVENGFEEPRAATMLVVARLLRSNQHSWRMLGLTISR